MGWLRNRCGQSRLYLGAYDVKPTSGQMLLSLCKGRLPVYPGGGKCFSWSQRLCAGTFGRDDTRSTRAEIFTWTPQSDLQRVVDECSQCWGHQPPRWQMPTLGTSVLGMLGKRLSSVDPHRFAGLNPYVLRSMQENRYRTGAKMIGELNVQPAPIEEAIEETIRWFKDNGYY